MDAQDEAGDTTQVESLGTDVVEVAEDSDKTLSQISDSKYDACSNDSNIHCRKHFVWYATMLVSGVF